VADLAARSKKMALVSKTDVVAAIERMYFGEDAEKAVRWVKKQPAWYVNGRGDVWAEHIAEVARGEEGELDRPELVKRCIEAVASEVV
jgi:hypothetical protein